MSDEFSYSRGRPPTESISRIADWDINDSIIPRVNLYIFFIIFISVKVVFALLFHKRILLLLL